MKKLEIRKNSLWAAYTAYVLGRDARPTHWHIRVGGNGDCYCVEDTSYTIPVSERETGLPVTIAHQQGDGLCYFAPNRQDGEDSEELTESLEDHTSREIDNLLSNLENYYEVELF